MKKQHSRIQLLTRDEEREFFAKIKAGDAKAKEEFLIRNDGLVYPIAKQYSGCAVPFEDLLQEGRVAISNSIDKFDPTAGLKFSTYAVYWIRQRVGRYAKRHSKNVSVPEHIRNLYVQISKVKKALEQEGAVEPTVEAVRAKLKEMFRVDATAKTVRETVEFCQGETSMSAKVGEDGSEFGDFLGDDGAEDPSASADRNSVSDVVRIALDSLNEQERTVVALRYGVTAGADTVAGISAKFGLDAEAARQAAVNGLMNYGIPESEAVSAAAV